jgi:AcrR family transcriptional regulator
MYHNESIVERRFELSDTSSMHRTKAAQGLATKEKLERIARELFAERGFASVSAEELVAKADVTRGALYHHYDGKEGLFEAVVDGVMQELHAKLVAAAAGCPDPLEALNRGIAVFLKVCAEPKVQRILLIDAPAVLGWPKWREMDAKYGLGLVKQALSGAMRAGLLRHLDAGLLAHVLLGALTESAMVIARSQSPIKTRKDAEQVLASVIAGWRLSN